MIRIVSCLGFGACLRRRLDRKKSIHWDSGRRLSALLGWWAASTSVRRSNTTRNHRPDSHKLRLGNYAYHPRSNTS
jgi:hypothetical protein